MKIWICELFGVKELSLTTRAFWILEIETKEVIAEIDYQPETFRSVFEFICTYTTLEDLKMFRRSESNFKIILRRLVFKKIIIFRPIYSLLCQFWLHKLRTFQKKNVFS